MKINYTLYEFSEMAQFLSKAPFQPKAPLDAVKMELF